MYYSGYKSQYKPNIFFYRILSSFNTVIVLIIFPLLPFEKMQLCSDLYEKLFETLICKTRRSSSFN